MQHYLEIPFYKIDALREAHKLVPIKGGLAIYAGATLPRELRPFQSRDFSYARWMEDERNALVLPPAQENHKLTLKAHQHRAVDAIAKNYSAGKSGFFLGDEASLGSGITALSAIAKIAKDSGFGEREKAKTLIVVRQSAIANWRNQLANMPSAHAFLRVMLLDYKDMGKIIAAPPQARISNNKSTKARQTAANGISSVDWDYIIFDDSHNLSKYVKNPIAKQAAIIAKLNSPYEVGKSPHVIFCSAHPGDDPQDLAIYSKIISEKIGGKDITPKGWLEFLQSKGYSMGKNKAGGLFWNPQGIAQANLESRLLRKALLLNNPSSMWRRIVDIPSAELLKNHRFHIEARGDIKAKYYEIWQDISQKTLAKKISAADALNEYQRRTAYIKMDAIMQLISDGAPGKMELFIVKVPSRNIGEQLSEKLLKKRIKNVVQFKGVEKLSLLKPGDINVLITTGNLSDAPPENLGGFSGASLISLDYCAPGAMQIAQILVPRFYNLKTYLPMLSHSVDERLGRILMDELSSGDSKNLQGRLERCFKAACAHRPKPNHLS